MNCMPNRLMNPVPMSGNIISRFRWVLVAVAAALLVVPLALHAQLGLAAPSNLAATIGDSTVTLSWTYPNDSSITKYQISTDGGSNFINILCGNSMATGYTVTGLTNGTPYTFQVRAYNNNGPGASATVTATPLFAAPTTLEAFPGDEFLHLRWDESTDSRISGYEVSSDGGTNYSLIEDRGHESETVGYSVLGLTNGTNYAIAVRAVDGAAATLNATPVIPALSRLRATPGYGRVTLSWRDPNDSRIKKYQFSSDGGSSYTSVAFDSTDLIPYVENNLNRMKYTITGLTNDTLYTFKVRTANADDTVIGAEAPPETKDPLTATPLFTAPSNLIAAPADGQVTLSWDDPNTTEISRYQLKIDGSAFADIPSSATTTTTTTEHTVTGLTNYTSYTFTVRAYDSNVAGPSAAVIAYPVAGPTAAPDNLQATPADGQVTLTWDNPNNASITGYEVSSDGGANYNAISGSDASTTSHTVDNLTNWIRYSFAVRAVNASGAGAPSKTVRAEPGAVPGEPGDFDANAKHERVELSWDAPDVRTAGYKVRYKKTNDNAWGEWVNNSNDKIATIDGLENATSYDFAVRAYNYIGGGAISELTASPVATAPLAPINLSAARGDGEVTLTWTDTRNDEIITYYHISSDGGTSYGDIGTNVSDSGSTTVSYIVRGLTNGTVYTFKVKAQNSAGTGPPSDPGVTETPLFAAPRGLQASPGDGQVTLSWDDPVYSVYNTNTITGYELSTDGGTSYNSITGSGADTTEHTVTELTGGTTQTFTVRAVNGVAATVRETPLFAPPTDLTALAGDQQITLDWTAPVPGNSAISGYEVSSDNGANYTPISGSSYTTISHTVTELTNGTSYSFAVRAVNCPANGAAAFATATPFFAAPANLSVAPGYGEVTLTWDDPGNNTITGYELSTDGGTNYSSITVSGAGTTINHTVTDLAGGTSYTFGVRAQYGAPAFATATPFFAAPTGLTATAGYGQVTLTWENPGNSDISKYQLKIDGGAFADIPNSDANTIGHTMTDLTGGTLYSLAVRAAGRLQSNVAYRFLLILSLSKDAHTSHRWFDRLTMSG